MLRGWKGKLVAAGTGLVLAYLLVEVLVVLTGVFKSDFYQQGHRRFFEQFRPHQHFGYVLEPNLRDFEMSNEGVGMSMTINSDSVGFTNPNKSYANASTYFIGDSFTFGAYMEQQQTFFGKVDAAIPSEMVNVALGGYEMAQYQAIVKHLVAKHQPDTVVLCLFANDLRALKTPEYLAEYYKNTGVEKYSEPARPWKMRTFTFTLWNKLTAAAPAPVAPEKSPYQVMHQLPNGTESNIALWRGRGIDPQYFPNGLNLSIEAAFRNLLVDLKRMGVAPCVVLIPSKEACYPEAYAEFYPEDAGYVKQEADGYKRLWAIAADEAVPFIDLTPPLRERSKTEQLYFDVDGHFNAAGHAYTAELLLQTFWNKTTRPAA